MKIKITSRP